MQQASLTSFNALSNTFRIATSTTGGTGVRITPIRDEPGRPMRQYYVVNASSGYLFFTLKNVDTAAVHPADAANAAGYVLPPNSAGTFGGPDSAYFSGDLGSGTGSVYVTGGEGL